MKKIVLHTYLHNLNKKTINEKVSSFSFFWVAYILLLQRINISDEKQWYVWEVAFYLIAMFITLFCTSLFDQNLPDYFPYLPVSQKDCKEYLRCGYLMKVYGIMSFYLVGLLGCLLFHRIDFWDFLCFCFLQLCSVIALSVCDHVHAKAFHNWVKIHYVLGQWFYLDFVNLKMAGQISRYTKIWMILFWIFFGISSLINVFYAKGIYVTKLEEVSKE